jgi:putative oxidoreductase
VWYPGEFWPLFRYTRAMNDIALFILRTVAGGFMLKYGPPKIRDVDGKFAKEFAGLGFNPVSTFVTRAGLAETTAGALLVLGALGPVGPMLLLSDMMVATTSTTARAKHFDPSDHEDELLYASIALLLALNGPGSISVDSLLGIRWFDRDWLRYLSVAGAFAGAAFMLSQRTPSPNT